MSTHDDLVDEIEQIASDAGGLGYHQPTATNDVYENFVWMLCIRAAEMQDAVVSYETVSGSRPTILRFRTSPGDIYSTAHQYTHAILDLPDSPSLEVHVGVKVTGKSGVLHECDVAVIDRVHAAMCRSERVHPRASRTLIAAECKFYTSAIQLHLGRGFLGLTGDIHRKDRYFVSNSKSDSVTKLVAHHKCEWGCHVLPNTGEATHLLHELATAFKKYKAAHL